MLKQLQLAFDAVIYHQDNTLLTALIDDKLNIKPSTALKIYRNNTMGALLCALFDVYPICSHLLGKNYFKQLAIQHINKTPSNTNNLDNYGENFSTTIFDLSKKHKELLALPYLQNLVDFEWLLNKCYYVSNSKTFNVTDFSRLTDIQQATCQLELAEDVFLLDCQYDIYSIWQAFKKSEEIKIKKQQQYLIIYKEEFNTTVVVISNNDYNLILATKEHTLTELIPFLQNTNFTLNDLICKRWITGFTHVN
ncbi:MAG: putative DNA-binding domain-containing protein [Alcanivoracaceae bacterium]|nr:putative DNA-binding domain-containing protein [Alcanivoracaceae bacterium]